MFLALKVVWLWAVWCFFTRTFVFLTLHSWSQGWRESQGKGIGGARREVEKGMGDEWQSGGKTRHIVTWKKKEKKKKNINSILCTQSPASQPPYFSLCSTWEGQTSTDWIWFICARIIWTLFKIFFWWPANVTPTLRMSLEVQTEADVRLMLPQAIKQSFTTYYSIYLSIFPSTHNMHVKDKRAFAKKVRNW